MTMREDALAKLRLVAFDVDGVFIAIGSNPNYMEQIYLWLKIG